MATISAKMTWGGGVKFNGTSTFGHPITTDIAKDKGGDEAGYRPTELLLYAIAGCTGVDVVRILQKQRQELAGLEIEVIAQETGGVPNRYGEFKVIYRFSGKDLDPNKLQMAVDLSEQKYCSVSETFRQAAVVTTAIEIMAESSEPTRHI